MANNRPNRGPGYGALEGAVLVPDRAPIGSPTPEDRKRQWPWLRVGIASVAVVASLGLLGASRYTGSTLVESAKDNTPSAAGQLGTSGSAQGTPRVAGKTGQAQEAPVVGSGEEEITFVASNEYTRRGDTIGRGYKWLEVG